MSTSTVQPITPVPSRTLAEVAVAANLRAGPGTGFAIVGGVKAGDKIEVVSRTPAGEWYQLASGTWIFAQLVTGALDVPVAKAIPTPAPTASTGATQQK
jgi:uncharacterized protein YraI